MKAQELSLHHAARASFDLAKDALVENLNITERELL